MSQFLASIGIRYALLIKGVAVLCLVVIGAAAQPGVAFGQEEAPAANPAPAAAEGAAAEGEAAAEGQQPGFSFTSMIPLYLGLFLLWYLIVLRPQSNQRSRRAELLDGLKKNDKVVTVGGIVGTVANVHESTGEVTIRSNDTSIRVQREAIRDVVDESEKEES